MSTVPLVSIVTLNYTQTDVTCARLAVACRLTHPRFETMGLVLKNLTDLSNSDKNGRAPADRP